MNESIYDTANTTQPQTIAIAPVILNALVPIELCKSMITRPSNTACSKPYITPINMFSAVLPF